MTLTIELPEELVLRLAASGLNTEEVDRYAAAGVVAALTVATERAEAEQQEENAEAHHWWSSLTDEERERERAHLERGLADIDAGRTRSTSEVYERICVDRASRSAA